MKSFFLSLLVFASGSAFAAQTLICQSYERVDGWKAVDVHDYLRFTAYLMPDGSLGKARVDGAYASDMRDLSVDPKYVPKSPAYKNYNRYPLLEDAWHWFTPLLPKDILTRKGKFTGYMQIMGEDEFKGTVRLRCFVR